MIIKRIETTEAGKLVSYMDDNGTFIMNRADARIFTDRETAEMMIDLEKSDPVYDKCFMGHCDFIIEA